MITKEVIKAVEKHTYSIFENFPKTYTYHNWNHTKSVLKEANKIAAGEELSTEESRILSVAVYFHDTGYVIDSDNHELESAKLAQTFLSQLAVEESDIKAVEATILATKMNASPRGALQKIIRDADTSHIGKKKSFAIHNLALREEYLKCHNREYNDQEWYKYNEAFFQAHEYHTLTAKEKFTAKKAKNLKKLEGEMIIPSESIIQDKNAQNMMKTAMRNHIDLTKIADNKANIILTIL